MTRTTSVVLLGTSILLLTFSGLAYAGCKHFDGPFSSVLVPPPACTSPIGLCTHGHLSGDLEATYDFTFASLAPAGDPSDPTKFFYTGTSIVTTSKGVITTADTGVISGAGPINPFVTTAQVAGGTHRYKNASGAFVATGELNGPTGVAVGTYTATICHGNGD